MLKSAMRIVIGSMQCEGNSLTPIKTTYEDFDYAAGADMLKKLAISELLNQENCQVIPTIYAHALPGGPVRKADFLRLADDLISRIPEDGMDGIWLYLHGAMCVEDIGSGDTYLLQRIREKVGFNIPISIAMDFHADNSDEIVKLANCITGFRTAPHRDHAQTQQRALQLLIKCIRQNILPSPQIARANVIICGDAVQTDLEPLKGIMEAAEKMERSVPGLMCVQVFNGQPWIDEEYTGPSFVVTHESDPSVAMDCAKKLSRLFYDARHDFEFLVEAVEPEEAIARAMVSAVPVFISDSGDNPTAGAPGDNGYMINLLQKAGAKNVLVAGIADSSACDACYKAEIGDTLTLSVGGSLAHDSQSAVITGRLVHRGDILSYQHDNGGPSATLDCGNMTVVITKNRAAICRPDIFESIDLDYHGYQIVVVKLGYLFPELAADAKRSILAFTPGASTEQLKDMGLQKIRRPMYPLDDDFLAED